MFFNFLVFFVFFVFFFSPIIVFAQESNYTPLTDINEFSKVIIGGTKNTLPSDLPGLINFAFYVMLAVAVVLAIFGVIRGGYVYLTSGDNGSNKSRAKRILQASVGGLLLALGGWLILNTINPQILVFNPDYKQLSAPAIENIDPTISNSNPANFQGKNTGDFVLGAEFSKINNMGAESASADGFITVNGRTYEFRSGGGGYGYLPQGTYTVTNGRLRNDVSSMMVNGYGYSFDLNDAYDERVQRTRTLLRIHPDGGNPGTAGCIGIRGDEFTQMNFYEDLQTEIRNNGGSYTLTVGGISN